MRRRRNADPRVERRKRAQDIILKWIGNSFYEVNDSDMDEQEKSKLTTEMSRQMERIERLFGYTPGSWGRG